MEVMNRINTQMKSSVISMANDERFTISRVPTGSLTIDRLTGGGFARGRHVEVYGDWTVGKSLLSYMTLILAQERGEICAVIDPENVFESSWFTELGGDIDSLLMPNLGNAGQMGNVLRLMEQKTDEMRGVDIVLIDSVASLLTKEEEDYDHESEKNVRTASLARFMSLLLRQITMQNQDTLFLWTNQWRDKISHIPGQKSTPGGLALGYYASTRIEMMKAEKEVEPRKIVRGGKLVERKVATGVWVNCTAKKEKTGAIPEQSMAILLDYEKKRFDVGREIIDLGMRDDLIRREGDHFIIPQIDGAAKKAHGIKNALKLIDGDDELRAFLTDCIEERTVEMAA